MMAPMHRLRLSSCLPLLRALGVVALLASPVSRAQDAPLPAPISEALQRAGMPPSALSLLVWPVDTPTPRLAHLATTPRPFASVMKLFTTGAGLLTLGPAWTWSTDTALGGPLSPDGVLNGSLYIKGQGDPALLQEHVSLMVNRWRAAGLREIRGDIVFDRQWLAVPAHDPAAFDGRPLRPYNAGPDALLVNHQSVVLRFVPDASRPGQIRVAMDPPLDGVELHTQLTIKAEASCGDWREAMDLRMAPIKGWHKEGLSRWSIQLRGPYPLSCGEKDWPVLWQGDGPGDLAARLLQAAWRQAGGTLKGQIRDGAWPENAAVWQRWTSPPLGSIVRDINKFSNNVMARQLFLTQATAPLPTGTDSTSTPSPATLDAARTRVSAVVRQATTRAANHTPCDGEALVLDNGSGLSRMERTSAMCLGEWLQVLWRSPVMPELMASLPITSVDGTTKRWQGAAGYAHIKTGSLDGVSALGGYVDGQSGRRQVVVAVVQYPRNEAIRPVMEAILNWARQDLPN